MKTSIAENFMRPAKAPIISVAVRIANVIWKQTKSKVGMEPDMLLMSRPLRNTCESPPTKALPGPKASE